MASDSTDVDDDTVPDPPSVDRSEQGPRVGHEQRTEAPSAGTAATAGVRRRVTRRRPRRPFRSRLRDLGHLLPGRRTRTRIACLAALALGFVGISLHNGVVERPASSTPAAARAPAVGDVQPLAIGLATGSGDPAATGASSLSPVPLSPTAARTRVPDRTGTSAAAEVPAEPAARPAPGVVGGVVTERDRDSLDTVLTALTGLQRPVAHVVGDGGSWWRAARGVIDDPVSIDRLVDNLSASGLDVGHVTPGAELVVDAAVSDAHLVRIDAPDGIYLSRVSADDVVTSAYRSVAVTIGTAPEDDLAAAGVPPEVIDELTSGEASFGLDPESVGPGDEYGILFRATRAFRDTHAETRLIALSRNGRLLRVEPRSPAGPETPAVREAGSGDVAHGRTVAGRSPSG